MRLTLHIGTTKSGTTSLQGALFQCAPALRAAGVYYDRHTHNQNCLELLARDESRWTREFRSFDDEGRARAFKDAAGILARLRTAASDRRYTDAVVSAEYLSLFNAEEVTRLLDRLDLPDVEIRVACYVRRPSQHWLSLCQQLLKASGTFPTAREYRYNVQERLEAWQSDPRIRTMVVRPFDRAQLTRGNVISDFVANVVPAAGLIADVDVRANEGLTAEAAILQQRFRAATHPGLDHRFTPVGARVLKAIEAVSRDVPGTPLKAHQALLDLVDRQHAATLRWLSARHGVQLVPADELERLEALEIDATVGQETRVEEICTSFDPDVLERLTFGVMHRLASDDPDPVTLGTRLARLGSRIRRKLTGR